MEVRLAILASFRQLEEGVEASMIKSLVAFTLA